MVIRDLENIVDEVLNDAFISAFTDYEIRIDMSLSEFNTINQAKDFDRKMCLGAFVEEHLVGFILVGIRTRGKRKLAYDSATAVIPEYQSLGIGGQLLDLDESYYNSFEPTWQNTFSTYRNSIRSYNLVTLNDGTRLAAYGIIHKSEGSVLQFGVHPEYRLDSIYEHLLTMLMNKTNAAKINFINLEDGYFLIPFLEKLRFDNYINQYEMKYEGIQIS